MEFVRQAQVRRPFAVLQRKLEHDNDIERPQHGQIIQYSNKMNVELNAPGAPANTELGVIGCLIGC